ncbi:MAG: MoxR family ATPase [Pirellulales bacterium]
MTRLLTKSDSPDYVIEDDGLIAAVNAAILLQQPLLVTGEPGTGKTTLAGHVARELGLGKPLSFETKSTSVAKDLYYQYDAVGRFHAAHEGRSNSQASNLDYLTFHALGKAILLTGAGPPEVLQRFRETENLELGFAPRQSVVVIDEIDKAHRDFPNDLLNEIDRKFFTITEHRNTTVDGSGPLYPLVLITSNSERNLPDPFLRRCVYYHIEFPNRDALIRILNGKFRNKAGASSSTMDRPSANAEANSTGVGSRSSSSTSAANTNTNTGASPRTLFESCVDFFREVRGESGSADDSLTLRKKPATSELVGWVQLLSRLGADPTEHVRNFGPALEHTMGVLAKCDDDLSLLRDKVKRLLKTN